MNDVPLATELALGLTRAHVNSARPDAPVVRERNSRPRRRVRSRVAAGLRRVAEGLEPCEPTGAALRT
jgi:hypothetical protein